MSDKFLLFGFEHLVAIGIGVLASFIIILMAYYMNKKGRVIFIRLISLLVFMVKVGELLYRYYYNGESYINLLPLHLCNLTLILALIVSFTQSTALFQPLYFWGIGALFAIITPELTEGFKDPVSLSFFITHFFILLSMFYTMLFFRFRPTKVGSISSFILLNIILIVVFFVNKKLGTNYLYVNRLPATSTILDVLGEWPYYIFSVEMVYIVLSFVLYYPFRERRFKYNSFR